MVKGDYLLSFVEWGLYQFAGAEEGFVLQRSLLTPGDRSKRGRCRVELECQ
jgi:hypothetical protein